MTDSAAPTTVHLVSLGCSRNEVDSEELAARLEDGGFVLVEDPEGAAAIMVNTCGFIASAKKDSIDTLLAAADLKSNGTARAVVAVGCMAERYGSELAAALPEADAVLGFDSYADIAARLRRVMAGEHPASHTPGDRRRLLPLTPAARPQASLEVAVPGHGPVLRRRLGQGPFSPLKIASGCDRRCAFCAIPSFRGSYISRPASEVVAEARWLVGHGVREAMLVSENTSSYGKDFGDPDALPALLRELDRVEGLDWIRVSYLQPAEIRPGLIETMATLEHVVPYFDLSFQHASGSLLRRMRRFGNAESFLGLLDRVRAVAPDAGIRTNVIVGFPGETDNDVAELKDFLTRARLDVVGVFGYSDEEGTEGERLDGHLDEDVIEARRAEVVDLVEALCDQRAQDRVGDRVQVLIEETGGEVIGRTPFQGPEVDGSTTVVGGPPPGIGELVDAVVVGTEGVDLIAERI